MTTSTSQGCQRSNRPIPSRTLRKPRREREGLLLLLRLTRLVCSRLIARSLRSGGRTSSTPSTTTARLLPEALERPPDPRGLLANRLGDVDLEELDTTKLEPALRSV